MFRPYLEPSLNNPKEATKEVEDTDQFIEIDAFAICEEDNENGLTWKEVSDCIVSHFIYLGVIYYKFKKKHTCQFQEFLTYVF